MSRISAITSGAYKSASGIKIVFLNGLTFAKISGNLRSNSSSTCRTDLSLSASISAANASQTFDEFLCTSRIFTKTQVSIICKVLLEVLVMRHLNPIFNHLMDWAEMMRCHFKYAGSFCPCYDLSLQATKYRFR